MPWSLSEIPGTQIDSSPSSAQSKKARRSKDVYMFVDGVSQVLAHVREKKNNVFNSKESLTMNITNNIYNF